MNLQVAPVHYQGGAGQEKDGHGARAGSAFFVLSRDLEF